MTLKVQLCFWAKFSFGSIKLKKLALLNELELLDSAKETRLLQDTECKREEDIISDLFLLRKQEELYWKQRSRLQWLKEGDENTSFFHVVANSRKYRNFIPNITFDGDVLTNPKEIGKAFVARFHQQFGSKRSSRLLIDFRKLLANRNYVDLLQLEIPFSIDLGKDKAPGPDGFPLQFSRQFGS